MSIPLKMRIDNASNIYTASRCRKYTSIYRLSVSLSERIDEDTLQQALENTLKRIPLFGYTVSNGIFWWHLKRMSKTPRLLAHNNMMRFCIRKNGGFLFNLSTEDYTIYLDVFHVIADGNGSRTFLLTLCAEYLRLRYGIEIEYNDSIFNTEEEPQEEELEDGFDLFKGKKGSLEKNDKAYHISGTEEPHYITNVVRMTMPVARVKEVAKEYNCTITELISACMVSALQDVRRLDKDTDKSTVLKVSIPVNLRNIFHARTLRNFSSYVNVGIDVCNDYFDFDKIVNDVVLQKRLFTTKDCLERKVAANVALEENKAICIIPRIFKRPIIDIINRLKGDRYNTQTFSNLGNIELPKTMIPYVKEMDFILGRQRGNSGAAACIGYNGTLYLNFSRKIVESDFEDFFCQKLRELGIPVYSRHTRA